MEKRPTPSQEKETTLQSMWDEMQKMNQDLMTQLKEVIDLVNDERRKQKDD